LPAQARNKLKQKPGNSQTLAFLTIKLTSIMAPNAKPMTSQSNDHIHSTMIAPAALVPERNVTYGVNYSISKTPSFVSSASDSTGVEPTVISTRSDICSKGNTKPAQCETRNQSPTQSAHRILENKTNQNQISNMITNTNTISSTATDGQVDKNIQSRKQVNFLAQTQTPQSVRKSRRQPKPKAFLSPLPNHNQSHKSKVRYDINLVPLVKKDPHFVHYWRLRDNHVHVHVHVDVQVDETTSAATENSRKRDLPLRKCNQNVDQSTSNNEPCESHPFDGDETILWIPEKRQQWEDCLSELTAVCKSAAFRKYASSRQDSRSPVKPFYAPLSPDYIRDRIDIDDPLVGYQFRHKTGGWLQGFLMFTNFTTWSHYFKWDSMHFASGVPAALGGPFKVDADGSISSQLENQKRSGDPLGGGIVFQSIAEISLIGGLACGEYLLRMALDDITSREQYQYVVLQATDSSRTFYEKFGFARVGAISRYGPRTKGRRTANELSDIVGYRHWTYAHESELSLGKHGGPSYMMALRIDRTSNAAPKEESFLTTMQKYAVMDKPRVRQLGAAPTPMTKKSLMASIMSPMPNKGLASMPVLPDLLSQQPPAPPSSARKGGKRRRSSVSTTSAAATAESVSAEASTKPAPKKRRRVASSTSKSSNYQLLQQRDELLAPPPPGQTLTYAQKQYQSVWLAVPARSETPSRRPPRERPPIIDSAAKRGRTPKGTAQEQVQFASGKEESKENKPMLEAGITIPGAKRVTRHLGMTRKQF
jgi:hypothetical protein